MNKIVRIKSAPKDALKFVEDISYLLIEDILGFEGSFITDESKLKDFKFLGGNIKIIKKVNEKEYLIEYIIYPNKLAELKYNKKFFELNKEQRQDPDLRKIVQTTVDREDLLLDEDIIKKVLDKTGVDISSVINKTIPEISFFISKNITPSQRETLFK